MAPDLAPVGPETPGEAPVPDGAAPPTGRAGRNLPAAIAVGLTLGVLIVVPLYSPYRWGFIVVLAAAASVGSWEIVAALRRLGAQPTHLPVLVGGAVMIVEGYREGSQALFIGLLLTVLACMVWRLVDPAEGFLRDVSASVFTVAYVPFLAGFAALLTIPHDGPRRVTAYIVTVVCSDIGGYAAGVAFGRHPMAPSVSPKKSWEGFAGSAVACALAGMVFLGPVLHAQVLLGVVFGLAVVVTATLGDLGESMVKRDIGIKDMGRLLPGHGGLMDRLDSLLTTAPVAFLLLTAFVPLPR
ncbi:MAG: phosphatidate cytidylyltransferase [Actinomycetota bacterium]|nr:phosphatidate cytidylyltransferase [Actinomycetota bacterium]